MGRAKGTPNKFNRPSYDDNEYFNNAWWAGAAERLHAAFPRSIKLTYRKPKGEELKISSKMIVKSWDISYDFLCARADRLCHIFDFYFKHDDMKVVLLYCLYHQRMTHQAIEHAEKNDRLFSFFVNMRQEGSPAETALC